MPYQVKDLKSSDITISPNSPEKNRHDKMSSYAKYVKEMYKPSISQSKVSEMESLRRKVEE
eukprot:CAMPEP_0116874982 /NCGR_PEP_ID=MMETSP0463-20121206/6666_1 /TAXON_ID=181622 /ORGANISM="Strombidinopsis sp, Strain SopsisLIS2011" /LENGTH=60 /DNA_ID=CAMNT_0004519615 /DNA_START=901 /DNA_END=1083 /DNA_ORIENTATION=-